MTITNVENASVPINLTVTPIVIYGGVAGTAGTGTGTSNSCLMLASSYALCNPNKVDQSTILRIHTNTTVATVGYPRIFLITGATGSTTTSGSPITLDPSSPQSAGAGDSFVAVTWGAICSAMGDGTNLTSACTQAPGATAITGTFRIGYTTSASDSTLPTADTVDVSITVSGNMGTLSNTSDSFMADCGDNGNYNLYGVCAFQATAGDQKITLTNPHADQGLNGPSLQFAMVRVLYAKTNYLSPDYTVVTGNSPHQDLPLSTDASGSFAIGNNARITGLDNESTYLVKLAMIDLAGNVGLYTANTTNSTAGDGDTFCPDSSRPTKCHLATPGEVVGVLSKSLNCFIATAAYGSPMAPQVETFRKFRNQSLLTNKWGIEFVRFYYKHSPKYAAIIAHSEFLRSLARIGLWPLLGYAWLAVHIGAKYAFALLGLFLGSIFLIGYRIAMGDESENENDKDGGSKGSQRA